MLDLLPQILPLLADHKWLPLSALLVGLAVRLLKEDVAFLPAVPAQYRAALALGLGMVSGALQAILAGKPWRLAVGEGLLSAALAILGHTLGIEWLRKGRELGGSAGKEIGL